VTGWTELPAGESFTVPAGDYVAVVASVKASHTQSDLQAFAQKRGLALTDYAEEGARAGLGPDPRGPDYRYVAAAARTSTAVSLPWEVPWPLSLVDDSQLVRAWTAPAGDVVPAAPPAPAPEPPTPSAGPSLWPLTLIGIVGGALWWRARRRE
jgi:hypothetical protein